MFVVLITAIPTVVLAITEQCVIDAVAISTEKPQGLVGCGPWACQIQTIPPRHLAAKNGNMIKDLDFTCIYIDLNNSINLSV